MMKTITKFYRNLFLLVLALVLATGGSIHAQTPVERHGWLSVQGKYIIDQNGAKTALHGVSFGWHNWWYRYFNESAVTLMAQDWKASIVRCSIGLDLDDKCFNKDKELGYATVDSMVNAAVKNGIYVLVDFHSHHNNLALAKEFFQNVTKKYGKLQNVLYEIWNEPLEIKWSEAKSYSEELLPIIRKNAPKSIVIIPTPRWDQNVDEAADDPIKGFDNIVYGLHFYVAFHKDDLRAKANYAISKGLPLFFAEVGGMMNTGDGVIDMQSWDEWMKIARENSISWIAWSISDKVETCSMLEPNTPVNAQLWDDNYIKPWGVIVRKYLRMAANENK